MKNNTDIIAQFDSKCPKPSCTHPIRTGDIIQRYESDNTRYEDPVWYHKRCAEILEKGKAKRARRKQRDSYFEAYKNYELPEQKLEHLKYKVIPELRKDVNKLIKRNQDDDKKKPSVYTDDKVVPKMRIIDEESNNAK